MDLNEKNKAEVLIVGAGPTGLMMACQLSLFDIPFRIIDKKKYPAVQSGAMILHSRSLEYFQQLGLAKDILLQGKRLSGLSVIFSGKKRIRLDLNDNELNFSEFPYVFMIEQSKTERLLIDYLEQKGHRIEWETELVSVVQSDVDVETGLIHGDGSPDVVTVKYVVGADGGKSKLRDLLKISFEGETHSSPLVVMECDADLNVPGGEAMFTFSRKATTGFFPLPGGKWRVDAAFRKKSRRLLPLNFEKVQAIFNDKAMISANIRNESWFSVFHSHGRHAGQFLNNRCFLAGDAAHLFTPVGGQGLNTGIQDACNLAWKLALVLRKRIEPDVLYTYEEERKPVAIRTCRWSDFFFKVAVPRNVYLAMMYSKVLPPLLNLAFRLMKTRKGAEYFFKRVSGTGISYDFNQINRDVSDRFIASAPKPGDRLPFTVYKVNGKETNLYQKTRADKFLLLAFGDRKNVGTLTKAVSAYKDLVITEVIPFSRETSILYLQFGIKTQGWYLVRPDMYIASRSDESGEVELREYMHILFSGNG